MKKILVLCAAILMVAPCAFAASGTSSTSNASLDLTNTSTGLSFHAVAKGTADKDSPLIGKCSTGVSIAWYLDSTNGEGYAMMTQHMSGTKAYGTSYDSTAIYITVGDATPGTPVISGGALTATDTTDFATTDWKKM